MISLESPEKKEDASVLYPKERDTFLFGGHARQHRSQFDREEAGSFPNRQTWYPPSHTQCPKAMWVGYFSRHPRTAVWGLSFTPSLFFAQRPRERQINKETQEVLIWHCPDFFLSEPFVRWGSDAPLHFSVHFLTWGNLFHHPSSIAVIRKLTIIKYQHTLLRFANCFRQNAFIVGENGTSCPISLVSFK